MSIRIYLVFLLIISIFVSVIMADDWGVDESPVVVAPEVQDIKLFGKWSTDDVQVSDISLTVSIAFLIISNFRTS